MNKKNELSREELKEKYRVYCIINNLVESERGFLGYISDQRMLERIRQKREGKK